MNIEYIIDQECKGLRVDTAISKTNKQYSRSLIQKWIKSRDWLRIILIVGIYLLQDHPQTF